MCNLTLARTGRNWKYQKLNKAFLQKYFIKCFDYKNERYGNIVLLLNKKCSKIQLI